MLHHSLGICCSCSYKLLLDNVIRFWQSLSVVFSNISEVGNVPLYLRCSPSVCILFSSNFSVTYAVVIVVRILVMQNQGLKSFGSARRT